MIKRISKRSDAISAQNGFTIVELLVVMGISLVVMAGIYSAYTSQQQSYITQDQVAAAQQNLRAAMYVMTRDLRMAGFDATQDGTKTTFGITDAQPNTITFTYDKHDEGTEGIEDTNERIIYSLNGNDELVRNAGGGDQVVAENIAAIGFGYSYDSDGDDLPEMSGNEIIWAYDSGSGALDVTIEGTALASSVPISNIKSVKIWILARTDKTIRDYIDGKTYTVGSSVIAPEAGYMYRLLSETVRCRNL